LTDLAYPWLIHKEVAKQPDQQRIVDVNPNKKPGNQVIADELN
jgi:hypothetical protein